MLFRHPWIFVACVAACTTTAVISDPNDDSGEEDTDVDTDTDSDADTDTDTDTEPGPVAWDGQRVFSFANVYGYPCTDTVYETGIEVTEETEYAEALAVCAECERLFWAEVSPTVLCDEVVQGFDGFPVTTPILRGLEFTGGGGVSLYAVYENYNGDWAYYRMADDGDQTGPTITYSYTGSVSGAGYSVDGTVTLE